MFKKRLAISMFLAVLLLSALACETLAPSTPELTETPVDTATPEPSPTPTPIMELAFGQTYPGETWDITVVEFESVSSVGDAFVEVTPSEGFEFVGVTLEFVNPTGDEQTLVFSADTAVLISAGGEGFPMTGATLTNSLTGGSATGFMAGTFNGSVTLSQEGIDTRAFTGEAGSFRLVYTLLPGQSSQWSLIFTIEAGAEIVGLDIGDEFPLLLVR